MADINYGAVLSFNNVGKSYNPSKPNEVSVFQDLSIEVNAGEVVGLIAPSGAGKSTLLNLAGLLDSPTAGQIHMGTREVTTADDEERTKIRREEIGFVFQFHHLLNEFTALENVMLPVMGSGMKKAQARERAMDLLEGIGLADRANHRPTAMSGGEQQRVAICRALVNKPKLLLADEPTGNLDPENSERVFNLFIDRARQEGLAALVATHNMQLASQMDRVLDLTKLRRGT